MAKSQIHSLLIEIIERIKKLGNQGMRKMCRIDAHLGNLLIAQLKFVHWNPRDERNRMRSCNT